VSPSRLERLAYRLLGSAADAEDVVQEARLRLLVLDDADKPDNEEAWLYRVVTNLALDRLRARKRQEYLGPWVPEPVTTDEAPDAVSELAEDLSVGFMMMLERLSPPERAVFVLREGFDLSFAEIGGVLDASEAACRQRFRRARAALAGEKRHATPAAEQAQLLEALLGAIAARDHGAVVKLLADDAVVYADGGGVVSAAIQPVTGVERIAQVALHLAARAEAEAPLEIRYVALNQGVGALVIQGGRLHSCMQVEGSTGRIERLYVVRNPAKLARLADLAGLEITAA